MERKKEQFDLYVHGNIIIHGDLDFGDISGGATVIACWPYEDVDLTHGIIVAGDMEVDYIYTANQKIGASGFLQMRGFRSGVKEAALSQQTKGSGEGRPDAKGFYTEDFRSSRSKEYGDNEAGVRGLSL